MRRRFSSPEAQLDDTLNSYFRVDAPSRSEAVALVSQLKATAGVMDAYLAPQAVPLPASPDLTPQQATYTASAPHGIGINTANFFGIHGSGVSVFDLEYSWNKNHEDLTDLKGANVMIANGTPVDPFSDTNHGTAVIGELDANPNSFGVTGLAYGSSIHTINVDNVERGYDLGNAITQATSLGHAGDVILVEQQQVDANSNFVPVEYYGEYYDAIKAATAKGLIVIEPAGNGGRNLDDPAYGDTFPFNRADSGAIIVGAGAPANCADSGGTAEHGALGFSDYGTKGERAGRRRVCRHERVRQCLQQRHRRQLELHRLLQRNVVRFAHRRLSGRAGRGMGPGEPHVRGGAGLHPEARRSAPTVDRDRYAPGQRRYPTHRSAAGSRQVRSPGCCRRPDPFRTRRSRRARSSPSRRRTPSLVSSAGR